MYLKTVWVFCFYFFADKVLCNEEGFRFQKDNIPTPNSYAYLFLNGSDGDYQTTEISTCFWVKPEYFRQSTYVFSYATSTEDNNQLNFGIRK